MPKMIAGAQVKLHPFAIVCHHNRQRNAARGSEREHTRHTFSGLSTSACIASLAADDCNCARSF